MKKTLIAVILSAGLVNMSSAWADYIDSIVNKTMKYDLDDLSIPATVGAVTKWHDADSVQMHTTASSGTHSYMTFSVNGTLLGDGVTWATSNPGIGIQYQMNPNTIFGFTPNPNEQAPDYRMILNKTSDVNTTGYLHIYYRLIRLLEKVPAGKITTLPDITVNAYNPDGEGAATLSQLVLSGLSTNIKTEACGVNAPTEIKLSPLYGKDIQTGALNVTDAQTITLTNCPGAINGINYNFSAVYGTNGAAIGVLRTATGEGYAKEVYVQIQNADGTPHTVNGAIKLEGYDGSGDYKLPDFKVAYYVYDPSIVTAGNVKSAIEIKVTYN
ncbi:fimbrial protein [Salmonella enterica subsp. enterica]|nr:type 1 fimbrial protein [Salmonella enterica subsp. enterica]EDW9584967.1 fimbrial protein [Salmonella enterica subsp. enterica]EED9671891.1 fimbrial protein [Salmonella enterica subsp. enterica]EIO7469646.1 fimbrial protein [Salmonella enterica subsp. enterica]EIY5766400.1 fimbrial protein [Salmonella enterica subsp. enterica]